MNESDDIYMEGLLRRRQPYFRVYIKFYVVLRKGRIDLFHDRTQELQSSIVLTKSMTCTELTTRKHKQPIGHTHDQNLAFSIMNGTNTVARLMGATEEEANTWRKTILAAIENENEKNKRGKRRSQAKVGASPEYLSEKLAIASKVGFDLVDNVSGINVYREVKQTKKNCFLKAGCEINCSSETLLQLFLNDNLGEVYDEWEERVEVLEDNPKSQLRVEHVRWMPVRIYGCYTKPRDFVLQRYWMQFENGNIMVTYRSTTHPKAPISDNYVRGTIWMLGYLITPMRKSEKNPIHSTDPSCWIDCCLHFDPKGLLSKTPLYFHQLWGYTLVKRLSLLRESVVRKLYQTVDYQQIFMSLSNGGGGLGLGTLDATPSASAVLQSTTTSNKNISNKTDSASSLQQNLKGSYENWEHIDLLKHPFNVRGKNYLNDKKKIKCTEPAFKLVASDLFETEGAVKNIAARADNITHQLVKEGHPFIFLVHFSLPGPPFYSFVMYFAAKPEDMKLGNPFGDLLNKFLNGDSEFRNHTFKLIPRVVDGNWIVKKSVGTKPAILGSKLAMEYYGDGETYFEVLIDVGSSSIAGAVLGVLKGAAKSLSIDMAFTLEGKEEDHLPERILGCIRCIHPDIPNAKKLPHYALPVQTSGRESVKVNDDSDTLKKNKDV